MLGTGAYFGLLLLVFIPIVGFLVLLILAFAPKNKNLKHFSRAALIVSILQLVLTVVLLVAAWGALQNVYQSINEVVPVEQLIDFAEQYQNGDFDAIIDEYQNGELGELIEQYQNGAFDGLIEDYDSDALEEFFDAYSGDLEDLIESFGG